MSTHAILSLVDKVKFLRLKGAVAAGQTDITDAPVIDMAGCDGITFIVGFGTITQYGEQSLQVHSGPAANDLGLAKDDLGNDVEIDVSDADDNLLCVLQVIHPRDRYLQLQIPRGTANAVVEFAIAIKHSVKNVPVSQEDTDVSGIASFSGIKQAV